MKPEEFDVIANSSLCDIESMKHKEKEIYGIQFHPEVHHTPKGEFIFKNFYIERRVGNVTNWTKCIS